MSENIPVVQTAAKDDDLSKETASMDRHNPNSALPSDEFTSVESRESFNLEARQQTEPNEERSKPIHLSTQCDASPSEQRPDSSADQRHEASSEQMHEAPSEQRPDSSSEQMLEAPSEQRPDSSADQMPEAPSEQRREASSEQMPEAPSEQRPDTSAEQMPEAPSEERPETSSEQMPEAPSEERPETSSEQMSEVPSEQRPDSYADKRREAPSEQMPEVTSENSDKDVNEIIEIIHKEMNNLKLDEKEATVSASGKKGRNPSSIPRARSTPIKILTSPPLTRSRSREMRKFPSTPASPARKGSLNDEDEVKGSRGRQRVKKNN